MERNYDVIVVGGGPAGLSAALILGRALRHTLVIDSGEPRNTVTAELHGYLTRDPVPPALLRDLGREQLSRYETVRYEEGRVTAARAHEGGFSVEAEPGGVATCRKLLLATGVRDEFPPVPGMRELYGRGVFHCPYCDGWEVRGEILVAYGRGPAGRALALELRGWSDHVTLCTDGDAELDEPDRERLARHGVSLREECIAALEGAPSLTAVRFASGERLACRALFWAERPRQRSALAEALGCRITHGNSVAGNEFGATDVPGLYVAGDASRSVQLAIVAAAEGAQAAFAINSALLSEDLR